MADGTEAAYNPDDTAESPPTALDEAMSVAIQSLLLLHGTAFGWDDLVVLGVGIAVGLLVLWLTTRGGKPADEDQRSGGKAVTRKRRK